MGLHAVFLALETASTYIREAPYLENLPVRQAGLVGKGGPLRDILGARMLAVLGDSITTDHISPA